MKLDNIHITIVGLGYVGLPLAVEFGKKYPTTGVDINKDRIKELELGYDRTRELTKEQIASAQFLKFENSLNKSNRDCTNIFIVTVPTPIDHFKKPDLRPLLSASKAVGQVIKQNDAERRPLIIYESTVYPGCTEEDCVPILEKESGLKFNEGFFCGYSPERINPGDKERTLTTIKKITSGSTPKITDFVDELYNSILLNGTFKAASIKVAEAAKLIENCQRDVNISFVNELALIFDRMNIDTTDVLEAAGSKWNFLPFKPGLVGGHCIGVDPYYMIHKAESLGYHPALIGAGRRINDNMGIFVANKVIKLMIQKGLVIKNSKILILGFTFKENCPDVRNTRVIDVYQELNEFGAEVEIFDPWADKTEVFEEYGVDLISSVESKYDAIILAVSHIEFSQFKFNDRLSENGILFDLKSFINNELVDKRL